MNNAKLPIINKKRHCEEGESLADFRVDEAISLNEKGFSPILIIGAVLIIGLFVFLFFFFKQNNQQLKDDTSNIPPGVVTDDQGVPCQTQNKEFCHESPDIDTWKDDGLP